MGASDLDAWRRLESLLEIADSVMTYRSRYQTSVQPALVIDLLLLDEANPRAVAFQLVSLRQRFAQLVRGPRENVEALVQRLRETPLATLAEVPQPPGASERARERPHLAALLDELSAGLPALADALGHAYLSHAVPTRQPSGVRAHG